MTRDYRHDPNTARATGLLCYLVVAQLVCHARTGEWLRTDHLVESSRMWVESTRADCGWLVRAEMGQASSKLASQLLVFPKFADSVVLAGLFTDGWQLDFRLPAVRGIYDVCNEHLYRSE